MKKIVDYFLLPVVIAFTLTLFFALLLVYLNPFLSKIQITSYCFLIFFMSYNTATLIKWLLVEYPKHRKIKQLFVYYHQEISLNRYIIDHNLEKVYVSRLLYQYYFKTLAISRIQPHFYYNRDGIAETRVCRLIVDVYLKELEFSRFPKNEIFTIDDLLQ